MLSAETLQALVNEALYAAALGAACKGLKELLAEQSSADNNQHNLSQQKAYIIQLLKSQPPVHVMGSHLQTVNMLLGLSAAELVDPQLVHLLLNAGADPAAVADPTSSSKQPLLLQVLHATADQLQVAMTVQVLVRTVNELVRVDISPDLLHQALLAAIQRQNLPAVRILLKLPAAQVALGMTDGCGTGLLYAAVAAPRIQPECLQTMKDWVLAQQTTSASPRTAAGITVLLHKKISSEVITTALTADAAVTSDIDAAAAFMLKAATEPLQQAADGTFPAATVEPHLLLQLLGALTQRDNGAAAKVLKQAHITSSLHAKLVMLLPDLWQKELQDIKQKLAAVAAHKSAYQCAFTSLAAEQQRLQKQLAGDEGPGLQVSTQPQRRRTDTPSMTIFRGSSMPALHAAIADGDWHW